MADTADVVAVPDSADTFGTKVKQADTILLGFPLGFADKHTSDSLTANDLDYYGQHTDAAGPAMTWAMFCVGYISLGQETYVSKAAAMFNHSFANVHPPFGSWMETPSGGTPNFLTGAGGFIQLAYSGYPGLRVNDTHMSLKPLLPSGLTNIKLRGVAYKGSRLDIAYSTTVSITLLAEARSATAKQPPILELVAAGGERQKMTPGSTITLKSLVPFSITEA